MSIKRQAIFNTFGIIISMFADWVITMVIPYLYGYYNAGQYAYAYTLSSIFLCLACFSIRNQQVLDILNDSYCLSIYFTLQLITTGISLLIFILIGIVVGLDYESFIILILLLLYQTTVALASPLISELQAKDRLDLVGTVSALSGVVKIVLFASFHCWKSYFILSVIGMVIGGSIFYFAGMLFIYIREFERVPYLKFKFSVKTIDIVRICFPVCVSVMIPTVMNSLPKMILQQISSYDEIGIYSTLTSITVVVPTLANGIFAPLVNMWGKMDKKGEIAELKRQYRNHVIIVFIGAIFILIVSVIPVKLFYQYMYGDYISSRIKIYILSFLSMIFVAIINYIQPIVIIVKKNYIFLLFHLICLGICICVNLILIKKYYADGAAMAMLISYTILAIVAYIIVSVGLKTKQSFPSE